MIPPPVVNACVALMIATIYGPWQDHIYRCIHAIVCESGSVSDFHKHTAPVRVFATAIWVWCEPLQAGMYSRQLLLLGPLHRKRHKWSERATHLKSLHSSNQATAWARCLVKLSW
ncbi:unnamed protein product [Ectocarpus sp. 12 AP-2014]